MQKYLPKNSQAIKERTEEVNIAETDSFKLKDKLLGAAKIFLNKSPMVVMERPLNEMMEELINTLFLVIEGERLTKKEVIANLVLFFEELKFADFEISKKILFYRNGYFIKNLYLEIFEKTPETKRFDVFIGEKRYSVQFKDSTVFFKDIIEEVIDFYRRSKKNEEEIKLDIASQRGFINNVLMLIDIEYSTEIPKNIKRSLEVTYQLSEEEIEKAQPVIIEYVKQDMNKTISPVLKKMSSILTNMEEERISEFLEKITEITKKLDAVKQVGGYEEQKKIDCLDRDFFSEKVEQSKDEIKNEIKKLESNLVSIESNLKAIGIKKDIEEKAQSGPEENINEEKRFAEETEQIEILDCCKKVEQNTALLPHIDETIKALKEELSFIKEVMTRLESAYESEKPAAKIEEESEIDRQAEILAQDAPGLDDIANLTDVISQEESDMDLSLGDDIGLDEEIDLYHENKERKEPHFEESKTEAAENYQLEEIKVFLSSLQNKFDEVVEFIQKLESKIETASSQPETAKQDSEQLIEALEKRFQNYFERIMESQEQLEKKIDEIDEKLEFIYKETEEARKIREKFLMEDEDEE